MCIYTKKNKNLLLNQLQGFAHPFVKCMLFICVFRCLLDYHSSHLIAWFFVHYYVYVSQLSARKWELLLGMCKMCDGKFVSLVAVSKSLQVILKFFYCCDYCLGKPFSFKLTAIVRILKIINIMFQMANALCRFCFDIWTHHVATGNSSRKALRTLFRISAAYCFAFCALVTFCKMPFLNFLVASLNFW